MRLKLAYLYACALAALLLVAPLSTAAPASGASAEKPGKKGGERLLGYTAESSARELALEERLVAGIDTSNLDTWMKRLSARPHHVGSPWGKENAEFMAGLFRSWGYDTAIEEFRVLLPTPKERHLELLEPGSFVASLEEEAIAEDSTSGQLDEQLPTYNAYSVDGDVTAELVYVNYGLPEDYEVLAEQGISVEGKIAIARYGRSWRGIKPKVAAENGAVGCIIYSDPSEDGYAAGSMYPEGGWRPEQGVQRGSVMDMPRRAGDPLTPYVGATADAERIDRSEVEVFTKIPVLPISARDAAPLLAALGGESVPRSWRGALPLAYHFGPGPAKVRLAVSFNWDLVSAYNVIARMEGSERPEQWILRGNHHDAWVNGATDPISGMVSVLEEARLIAELAKAGQPPKRTLVFAAWDAEEQGLLGSTEWAELHADELRKHAAVYVNSDSYGRGLLDLRGSHTLESFLNGVADDVTEPETGGSAGERTRAALRIWDEDEEVRNEARTGAPLRIRALGSGSDYTPFLQHLGIASLNIGFGGEGEYGQYHSIYDSYDHFVGHMDPGFVYGRAMVDFGARTTLRLANADQLPFEFSRFEIVVGRYLDELRTLADTMRTETAEQRELIEQGLYRLAFDPRKTYVAPPMEEPVPYLNFAPLENAFASLEKAVEGFEETKKEAGGVGALSAEQQARVDHILLTSERALLREEGLPERPWYRHYVYSPGFYTGYGVKTLPAVREAVEDRRWSEVDDAITKTAEVIRAFTEKVDAARAVYAEAAPREGEMAGTMKGAGR